VLLVLLVMPVALLLMLIALERYERLIVSDVHTEADVDAVDAPVVDVPPQSLPEIAPGLATEVA